MNGDDRVFWILMRAIILGCAACLLCIWLQAVV